MLAVVACAVAIPAGAPQPRPIAPAQPRSANPESEQLQGADDQDLKGSSSYGYGKWVLTKCMKRTFK